ncbi:hypothetical protein [Methylobacterium sp. J-059]|uniref:hypothetical protein n=1 Tax=Methylobacterium sp. J-059 TaxID=2836643 RepID=UPI001FB889E9|nr:hypothetical protein [Methylobacterium sp. J-059]
MTKIRFTASAVAAAAFGAVLMPAGAVSAATPAPAPSLVQPEAPTVQVRMSRRSMMRQHIMRRSMMRRGGGRTIGTKKGL